MQNNYQRILLISCAIIISSCNFTPKYQRDIAIFEGREKLGEVQKKTISDADLAKWWMKLKDPVSERLVTELLNKNLSLQEAEERLYQARKMAKIQGAKLIPNVGIDLLASQTKQARQEKEEVRKVDFSVSWQVDLFGKLRAARNSAISNFTAQKYDLEALTHSLIAEVISKRVTIYSTNQLLVIAKLNLHDAETLQQLTKRRYELGTKNVKISDFYSVKANHEEARREVLKYERILAGEISQLEILLAKMPGTITKANLTRHITPPKPINKNFVSASLLDRRPDLRAQEMRIIAANAAIGVAIADLFPDFIISANIGYEASQFNQLLSASNITKSILANMITKVFAGGAIKANIDIEKSKARALALQYADKIYRATGEAETNLRADYQMIMEYRSSQATAKLYERNKAYSKNRYMRGVEKLNHYLENKQKSYQASKFLIESERAMWKQRIALYLSLGGDWSLKKNIR